MALSAEQLKGILRNEVVTRLGRAGYSPKRLGEVQREILWWAYARAQAARNRRPLLRGWGIAWGGGGFAELMPSEVPRPGRGRVTVLVHSSAVSPGTERAQHLGLPNASVGLLGRPGYSAAGVAIAIGPRVAGIRRGDPVAVTGAPHASLVTVPQDAAYRVPPGVPLDAAAMIMLGVICGHGVDCARVTPGERVGVVGAGLVGTLALRLAAARGADAAAVIARSRHKEAIAQASGAGSFLTTESDGEAIAALELSAVIEATGDPDAIGVAVRASAPRGRIALLGSPRGVTRDLPLDELRAKRLEVIGAHVDTLDRETERTGIDARRRQGEAFLDALAEQRLDVADLVGPAIDPREAGRFYRDLTRNRDLVGAHFDWTRLSDSERRRRGRLLRVPDVSARGAEPDHRPLRPARGSRRGSALLDPGDPFAGATGHLRIGMLGCGDIATSNAAAAAAAPNTEVVAAFDPVERLARDVAARFGGEPAPSAEALIARDDVDLVLLSVPHHLHAPLAIQALRAGHHVAVEKPPANTLAAAAEMAAAARETGKVLSVCFPQRFEPKVLVARRLIEAGALGAFQGSAIELYLDKTPAYWLGGFSGRTHSDWRSSRERAGGGVLIMNLSHYIDLVGYLAGAEAAEVTGLTGAVDQPGEVEDAVSLAVRYEGGAVGSVVSSSAMRGMTGSGLRLWGSEGHITVEPRPLVWTLRALDGLRTGRWQTFGALPAPRSRAIYLSRLASAIDQGATVDVGIEDALAVQAFMEAAYRSSAEGHSVRPAELIAEARA